MLLNVKALLYILSNFFILPIMSSLAHTAFSSVHIILCIMPSLAHTFVEQWQIHYTLKEAVVLSIHLKSLSMMGPCQKEIKLKT